MCYRVVLRSSIQDKLLLSTCLHNPLSICQPPSNSIYMYTLTYTTVYLFIHFKHIFNISFFCLSINSFICSYININQYINQLIHSLCVYLITKYLLFHNCLFSIRKNVLMYLMWWGYLVYCLEKLTLAKDVFVKHKCPR